MLYVTLQCHLFELQMLEGEGAESGTGTALHPLLEFFNRDAKKVVTMLVTDCESVFRSVCLPVP